jgi:mRNA interferase RelE/StbE
LAYKVRLEKSAQKFLKKMDKFNASVILDWIQLNLEGTENPRQHGKGLTADKSGAWRYRVGAYRLIAEIQDNEILILILDIDHRSKIYKK